MVRGLGQGAVDPPQAPLGHPFDRLWHESMQRRWRPGLHTKNIHGTALEPCTNRGAPPLYNTHHLGFLTHHTPSLVVVALPFSCLEQGKATLESLTPWKKIPLGMNRNMSSSKAVLSYYNYSHTYKLEYSYYVMILIYELAYSLCVIGVAYLTLCLTTHITYIIRIRAKLR